MAAQRDPVVEAMFEKVEAILERDFYMSTKSLKEHLATRCPVGRYYLDKIFRGARARVIPNLVRVTAAYLEDQAKVHHPTTRPAGHTYLNEIEEARAAAQATCVATPGLSGRSKGRRDVARFHFEPFPTFLDQIRLLLRSAEESFLAKADCCDLGSFSDPLRYEKLMREIEASVGKPGFVGVRMLVGGASISRASQFRGQSLEVLRSDDRFRQTLKRFIEFHPEYRTPKIRSDADFIRMLNSHQEATYRRLTKAGVLISGLDGAPVSFGDGEERVGTDRGDESGDLLSRLFFWIADGTRALILNPGVPLLETSESKDVGLCKAYFELHWRTPLMPPSSSLAAASTKVSSSH